MNFPSQSKQSRLDTRSGTSIILLCMFITVIEGYNLVVYGSVVPLLLTDTSLAITDSQTGFIGGALYVGAILGASLAPIAADRLGRKRVLVIAIALFALGALFTGLSLNALILGAARFVTGLGVGGSLTTAMTVARNSASSTRASLVVTITMAGIPLGGVVAALLAIALLPALGWRPMFFIGALAALAILLAVALMQIPTDTPQEVAARHWSGRQKIARLFRGRGAVIAIVIALCAITNMVTWQGLNVWAAQAMVELGYSLHTALLMTFTLVGAAVVGSFATAWMADRSSSAVVAIFTGTFTLGGLIGMLMLPLHPVATTVCIALMGIGGHSTMNLVHTTTADIYPLPVRATALGWSNGTSFVGAFFGPVLGGTAIAAGGARGLFSVFAIAAATCLVAVIALYGLDKTTPADIERENPDVPHLPPRSVEETSSRA